MLTWRARVGALFFMSLAAGGCAAPSGPSGTGGGGGSGGQAPDPCATVVCDSPPAPASCFQQPGVCNGGVCSYPPANGAVCDDGDPCTNNDSCNNGSCAGTALDCSMPPGPAACYAPAGQCVNGQCEFSFADGASCDDGDACTSADSCLAGVCAGTTISCNTPPQPSFCYQPMGQCVAGQCQYDYADGTSCTDQDSCTVGDVCTAGVCAGQPITCSQPPPGKDAACVTLPGSCSNATCSYIFHSGSSCNDGDGCTSGDTCHSGECEGTPITCTTPPAPICLNAATKRIYLAGGTCAANTCGYSFIDVPCSNTCTNGNCASSCNVLSESISVPAGFRTPRLAVGPNGLAHITVVDPNSVAHDELWHHTRTAPGVWLSEYVDNSQVTYDGFNDYTKLLYNEGLRFDSVGGLHGVWSGYGNLRYGHLPAGATSWTLDSTGPYKPRAIAFAVSPLGEVHITGQVTFPPGTGDYFHYWKSSGTWGSELLATATGMSYVAATALAVDGAGTTHAMWALNDSKYGVKPTNGSWTIASQVMPYGTASALSMLVAPNNDIHLLTSGPGGTLWHAHKPVNGSWSGIQIDSSFNRAQKQALSMDAMGNLHVVYASSGEVRRAYLPAGGSTWLTQTLYAGLSSNWSPHATSAVDGLGGLHVVFTTGQGAPQYMHFGCPAL